MLRSVLNLLLLLSIAVPTHAGPAAAPAGAPTDEELRAVLGPEFKMDGLSDWAGFGIDFKDEDGNEIGEVVQQITPGTGYRSFSVAGIAPDDTETIVLWIVTNGGNGSLKVDDVMLNEL